MNDPDQIRKACRASSFQPVASFCHTIGTPILTGVSFPSLSISPVSVKREIALVPTALFSTSENSRDFHVVLPLVASAMNSAFV